MKAGCDSCFAMQSAPLEAGRQATQQWGIPDQGYSGCDHHKQQAGLCKHLHVSTYTLPSVPVNLRRQQVDKKTVLENLDLLLLVMDEVVDAG